MNGEDSRRLADAVAVVTGAGSGLGRAEALRLATEGAAVVVNDVDRADGSSAATDVVEEIVTAGGRAVACAGDIGDFAFGRRLVQTAIDTFGGLNILVNNAGMLRDRMVFGMSEEDWDAVIRVHLRGHFATTRWATAYWRETSKRDRAPVWGRVVNTASEAFLVGSAGQPNYAAAKAGIVALTLATASGCAAYGVTANAICPRAATAMTSANFAADDDQHRERFSPDRVAHLVAHLGARSSARITGQVLVAYGDTVHVLAAPTVAQTFTASGPGELAAQLDDYFDAPTANPGFAATGILALAEGWRGQVSAARP